MPATRRRRIVRTAVMALAVVVLLPVWYVGSVSLLMCVHYAGWMRSVTTSTPARWYVHPVMWYTMECESYPGSQLCWHLVIWSQQAGERLRDQ